MTHFNEQLEKMKKEEDWAREVVKLMDPPPENEWRAISYVLQAEIMLLREELGRENA